MSRPGKEFEEAVYAFLKSLASPANVYFNHKVKDTDTGRDRQVDCWIEAKLGGHIPYTVHVSCKDYHRRLNISHIESFSAERCSTGASMGIIYSHSHFSKQALEKAKALGISCCRLYVNQPADLPQVIFLPWYLCQPRIGLTLRNVRGLALRGSTWNDLFDLPSAVPDKEKTLLDSIVDFYRSIETESVELARETPSFPGDREETIHVETDGGSFDVTVSVHWVRFQAKVEANRLKGSYSYGNNSFVGTQYGPSIDMWSANPGEGWEPVSRNASLSSPNRGLVIRHSGNLKEALREELGSRSLS